MLRFVLIPNFKPEHHYLVKASEAYFESWIINRIWDDDAVIPKFQYIAKERCSSACGAFGVGTCLLLEDDNFTHDFYSVPSIESRQDKENLDIKLIQYLDKEEKIYTENVNLHKNMDIFTSGPWNCNLSMYNELQHFPECVDFLRCEIYKIVTKQLKNVQLNNDIKYEILTFLCVRDLSKSFICKEF